MWTHGDILGALRIGGDTLSTTEDHPFWNATDHAWQRADALDRGDLVLTADGGYATVVGFSSPARRGPAFNLTVDGIHTYHVGLRAVLVHNDCINWASNSIKTFGHTFRTHDAGAKNLRSLTGRATSTGKPQGQWLDNDAAADFLRGVHIEGAGPRSVRLPEGLAQVVLPDGSIAPARAATIIPRRGGVLRSAYPVPGPR